MKTSITTENTINQFKKLNTYVFNNKFNPEVESCLVGYMKEKNKDSFVNLFNSLFGKIGRIDKAYFNQLMWNHNINLYVSDHS